eukprot:TRINITY_DN11251_c2_g1_i4.p2 TRINITY_DN11251_c2_g1~~TRINITY_DN11251_c2_g1_i4.p2  ORF type:complete len:251 (-),score=15.11 TRINITY_DN11251_c2_g1_i4:70-822(-)
MLQQSKDLRVQEQLSDKSRIVISSVFDQLTDEGKDAAALAPPLLNGSFYKLQNFYLENMQIDKCYYLPMIDVIDARKVNYAEFVNKYMSQNLPVLIEGIFDVCNWPCAGDWVTENGQPSINYIRQKFGDSKVTCTDTSKQIYGQISQREVSINTYLDWWEQKKSSQEECLYVKDWHLSAEEHQKLCKKRDGNNKQKFSFYETPLYFKEDWLNDYFDKIQSNKKQQKQRVSSNEQKDIKTSDYRFVYIRQL